MGQDSEPLFARVSRTELHYCDDIEPIERLMVRVSPDGTLLVKGQRVEIDALLEQLGRQGLLLTVRYNSFCG